MTSGRASTRLGPGESRHVLDLAREIADNRRALRHDWVARLAASRTVALPDAETDPGLAMVPSGGFRLSRQDFENLGDTAKVFFADAVTRGPWTYLRGYGYYAADAQMYLPDRVPSAARRWRLVQDGWPRYADYAAELGDETAMTPIPWGRWLAWLAFLEAMTNDLCSAAWTARQLRMRSVSDCADAALQAVADLLAESGWHLWNDPRRARLGSWAERVHAVAADPALGLAMHGIGDEVARQRPPSWAVRAIREGDCMWQAAAAYELRWPALRAAHPDAPVLLLSEAYGAMSTGPLWVGLMTEEERQRVRPAACRLSVHEAEMGRVSGAGWRTGRVESEGRVVVHLDDSVFTGRTHAALRDVLAGEPAAVYLVPLTFDVGTPFNHPEEITALGRSVAEHLGRMEDLVRALGGSMPSATSLWARRKRPSAADGSVEGAFARVLGGSDRQLALLWDLYGPEVRRG
ncbi:hypothetical protein ACFV6E_33150 [Streptomyces sp. NPDC059785]|uniref:hypothetical protein n=1 Tax=Streptomyces sp. NPDC059785 TaxID=3346945 RepID=UPI00365C112D